MEKLSVPIMSLDKCLRHPLINFVPDVTREVMNSQLSKWKAQEAFANSILDGTTDNFDIEFDRAAAQKEMANMKRCEGLVTLVLRNASEIRSGR